MIRLGAGIVCLIGAVFSYALVHYFNLGWLGYYDIYRTSMSCLNSQRWGIVLILLVYMFMAAMVVVAFLRWSYNFSMDFIRAVYKRDINYIKEQPQTLENSLIIDSPGLQKPLVRFLETLFSAMVWLIFIYIFQVIPATFLWIFGLEQFYVSNFSSDAIQGTINGVFMILYTAAICFIVLFLWSRWNYWRYGRLVRRKPRPFVKAGEIGAFYGLNQEVVRGMQVAKRMAIIPESMDAFQIKFLEKQHRISDGTGERTDEKEI
jgi:poly-beta-1,6-N-acetyl-D-glucosamine biosynthesis protein PgaD